MSKGFCEVVGSANGLISTLGLTKGFGSVVGVEVGLGVGVLMRSIFCGIITSFWLELETMNQTAKPIPEANTRKIKKAISRLLRVTTQLFLN